MDSIFNPKAFMETYSDAIRLKTKLEPGVVLSDKDIAEMFTKLEKLVHTVHKKTVVTSYFSNLYFEGKEVQNDK